MFVGFSSRTKEEHDFRLYVIIVVVIATLAVTAIYAGISFTKMPERQMRFQIRRLILLPRHRPDSSRPQEH